MTVDGWDPGQYDRFQRERQQPFYDLLGLLRPGPGIRALDLGCGTGELTKILHRRLGAVETVGIDTSAAMLAQAAAHAGQGLRFEAADIAGFERPGRDVIFANASLHWLPDHDALLTRLTAMLAPNGQLAIQVPANWDHPSHTVAAEVAAEPPFVAALGNANAQPGSVLAPEVYSELLYRLGYTQQHVRLQVYGHHLESSEDVVEWVKGTLLTGYRRRLPDQQYDEFVAAYRERLLGRIGRRRPYFYPFKRILCWGRLGRPGERGA